MSHDDIRAALEAATRQPWVVLYPGQCCEGYCIESEDGRDAVAHGLEGSVSDLDLITSAPTWLAELLAENERLRDSIQHCADTLALHECERPEIERLTDENDRLRLADDYKPEGVDIVMAKLRDYRRRAEAAEQTIQRVRDLAKYLSGLAGGDRHYADQILRALDGGEH